MASVTLSWVAASSADATSEYKIYTDETTAGSFVVKGTVSATDRGDLAYTPYSTTLNGALADDITTVVLTSATNFVEGDYALVDREMILLGTKSSNTFINCTRGTGGSVPQAHTDATTVYKAHETSVQTITFNANRYAVRIRVSHLKAGAESVPVEMVAINPPAPRDTSYVTLWGLREGNDGAILAGETMTLTIAGTNPYGTDTGESFPTTEKTAVSGADGFFYFTLRRTATVSGRSTVTLSGTDLNWTVVTLPDQADVNYLETGA